MLNELLDKIEPRWRPALERLIEEGEADAEFLAYLESSPQGDAILNAALAVQSERIHAFGEAVRTFALAALEVALNGYRYSKGRKTA